MLVGSLGDLIFECSSEQTLLLQSFSVSCDTRYEDHVVQGTFPRPEFLGPNLPSHNLTILLRGDFLGHSPVEEIKRVQTMMAKGEVVRLVIAQTGYGRVTIRKMDYSWNYVVNGVKGPFSVTMNLELKEYA